MAVPVAYAESDRFFVPNRDSRRGPNVFGSRIAKLDRESDLVCRASRAALTLVALARKTVTVVGIAN